MPADSPDNSASFRHLELSCANEDQTIELGAALGRLLVPRDVIALVGDLGAGKTRLVRGIAQQLGVDPALVASPTYVVIHQYPVAVRTTPPPQPGIRTLAHVDAYRLHSGDELTTLGWEQIIDDPAAATIIEWADRISDSIDQIRLSTPSRIAFIHLNIEFDSSVDFDTDPTAALVPTTHRRVVIDYPIEWESRPGISPFIQHCLRLGAKLPVDWTLCPITRKPVPPCSPTFPFIDEQARLADLGKWFSGSYQVSRELTEHDLDDPDIPLHHPPP